MQVNPTQNTGRLAGITAPPPARSMPSEARAEASFAQTDSLRRALQATPDVREQAVVRGKALVDAGPYPPPEMLKRIAHLLAMHLGAAKDS